MKTAELMVETINDNGKQTVSITNNRSAEELFELTKQLGENVRVNPFSGESVELTPDLIALHDVIYSKIIALGDDHPDVGVYKEEFKRLNHDAYMALLG